MTLATELAMSLDPVVFGRHVGLELDPWQADVARTEHPRILLNCSRQSGKSQVTALIALWSAMYRPGYNILLLSPSQRQSSLLFRRVMHLLDRLPVHPKLVEENKLSLEFTHGARIDSLPASESTIRGYTANCIIIDEAARVSDELYRAVRPMLATTNGRLLVMSTPFGQRGFFYEEWIANQQDIGNDVWKRVLMPADQCPRITPEFLAEERRKMGDTWFQSEYMCRFVANTNSFFRLEDVLDAFAADDVDPLFDLPANDDTEGGVTPLFVT